MPKPDLNPLRAAKTWQEFRDAMVQVLEDADESFWGRWRHGVEVAETETRVAHDLGEVPSVVEIANVLGASFVEQTQPATDKHVFLVASAPDATCSLRVS